MASAEEPPRLTKYAYCIIVARPELNTRGEYNLDAVAAEIVNLLMDRLGKRQRTVHAMDLSDLRVRRHVLANLFQRGLIDDTTTVPQTPLFYSAYENVYAHAGPFSVNLLIQLATEYIAEPPTRVLRRIVTCPQHTALDFGRWGTVVEEALSSARAMGAAAGVAGAGGSDGEAEGGAPAPMASIAGRVRSFMGDDLDRSIASHAHMADGVDQKPVAASSQGFLQTEGTFASMETYADFSVRSQLSAHNETGPRAITAIPASLLRKAKFTENGVHIAVKEIVPKMDLKAESAREEARRKAYQRALERSARADQARADARADHTRADARR